MSIELKPKKSLAKMLSEVLHCKICIMDAGMNILDIYPDNSVSSDSLKLLAGCKNAMYRESANQEFKERTSDDFSFTELFIPIRDFERTIMGYLMLISDSEMEHDDTSIRVCLPAVEKFLLNKIIQRRQDENMDNIFIEILKGNLTDTDIIKRKLIASRFAFKKNMQFLFVESYKLGERMSNQQLISKLKSIWDVQYILYYQSNLNILICSDGEIVTEETKKKLQKVLDEYKIYGGFSEVFHKVDKYLGHYLCRAVCAAKAVERLNTNIRSAMYEEVITIALTFSEQMPYGIRKCCDPRLVELMEQDKANKTDYLRTLLVFWYFNTDREKASEYLCIHKNTLGYRIHYVEELLGINVYDPRVIISFMASVEMLEILKEIDTFL